MEDVSLLSLVGRLVVSLGVVLILMALLARVLKRRFVPSAGRRNVTRTQLEVVARQGLGRNASVSVVRAGEKLLVLGVTEQQVNLLTETDAPPDEEPPEQQQSMGAPWTARPGGTLVTPSPTWRDLVERLRERTARRS